MGTNPEINHIIFFDGVCNLCNSSVNFVIDRDPKAFFTFATLQSSIAQEVLAPFDVDLNALESIVYYRDGRVFRKSRAALEITRQMNGVWPMFYVFIIIPGFIRDIFYDLFAKNRYKWFGRQDSCRIPTSNLMNRFLDS